MAIEVIDLRLSVNEYVMLLIFKILLVPTIIALISIAGKIWGAGVSGLLGGLPVIAGPILVFLAIDHGDQFAQTSAQAALAGVISIGLFSIIYALSSQRAGVVISTVLGLCGFFVGTIFFYFVQPSLVTSFISAILALVLFLKIFPKFPESGPAYQIGSGDIFLRMFSAALLVLLITYGSEMLGPRLSGLLAPFPIAGTILASFTHYYCNSDSALRLLRGFIQGLSGMAVFDFIFSAYLSSLGISFTVLVGSILALLTSSITKRWT